MIKSIKFTESFFINSLYMDKRNLNKSKIRFQLIEFFTDSKLIKFDELKKMKCDEMLKRFINYQL